MNFAAPLPAACTRVFTAQPPGWVLRPSADAPFALQLANTKVLQHSNVETFVTFRSSTPVVLCLCDWAFLGRRLPCGRSWVALALLVASTAGYCYFDQARHTAGGRVGLVRDA